MSCAQSSAYSPVPFPELILFSSDITMPNKASTALVDFITGISDDKLKDIGESQHTIVKDPDFRLDMQGVSTA